jgi:hypothetical protein
MIYRFVTCHERFDKPAITCPTESAHYRHGFFALCYIHVPIAFQLRPASD